MSSQPSRPKHAESDYQLMLPARYNLRLSMYQADGRLGYSFLADGSPYNLCRSAVEKAMQQKYILTGFFLFLIAGGLYTLRKVDWNFELAKTLIGEPLPDDVMYPPSPLGMPACTSTPLPVLLAAYERILVKLGVPVETCLNMGLTDDDLDDLEKRFSLKFSQDIRNLYKWHNGTPESSSIEILPLGKLLPLDYSLELKNSPRTVNRDPRVEQLMDEMIAFQKSWIEITADGSGNGYYFDPARNEHTSSFFYHAHDDVSYDFYPCIGNLIQSLIDEYERGNIEYADGQIRSIRIGTYDEEVEMLDRYGRHIR
jgi:cell wall assembly regulator SMI1